MVKGRVAAGVAAVTFVLLGSVTSATGQVQSANTTAPQAVRLDTVVVGENRVALAFTEIPRGDVVVFKVHNASRGPVRFLMVPRTTSSDPGQGGSGFRTKLLKPGELASMVVQFSSRGAFRYSVRDTRGKERVRGKFLVT